MSPENKTLQDIFEPGKLYRIIQDRPTTPWCMYTFSSDAAYYNYFYGMCPEPVEGPKGILTKAEDVMFYIGTILDPKGCLDLKFLTCDGDIAYIEPKLARKFMERITTENNAEGLL